VIALLDTGFLRNLEAGDAITADAYERLRMSYQLRYLPISSHELVYGAIEDDTLSRQFLLKADIYGIERMELTGVQLDYAEKAAAKLQLDGLVKNAHTAHLLAEAAARPVAFLLTDSKIANSVRMAKVNPILEASGLNKVNLIKIQKVLQTF
jgi:hypothetical protein